MIDGCKNDDILFEKLKLALRERFDYWDEDIRDDDVEDFTEHDLVDGLKYTGQFKLYRYMPAKYFNIRNIEIQKIHLSDNGILNDIYEGLPQIDDSISVRDLQQLKDMAKIACFTEKNDNVLMWSHYADEHKGICVEYDLKRLTEDKFDILKHLYPVLYGKRRIIKKDISSLVESHKDLDRAIADNMVYEGCEALDDILPLFLTKGWAWEYEQEWRIIYTKKQMYEINDSDLYSGNLEFPCISGVYLGYRIDPEIKKNIGEICQRCGSPEKPIALYQAKLDLQGYDIRFEVVNIEK